jgi:hypothetical protein
MQEEYMQTIVNVEVICIDYGKIYGRQQIQSSGLYKDIRVYLQHQKKD